MNDMGKEEALRLAREWLAAFIEAERIDYDALTLAEKALLASIVPCSIRCWRIGMPVDVRPGEKCPECGRYVNDS